MSRVEETDEVSSLTVEQGTPAGPQTRVLGRIVETDVARALTLVGGDAPSTVVRDGTTQTVTVAGATGAGSVPVPIVVTIPDPDLDRAPTAVTVYVFGVPVGTDVQLSIDGNLSSVQNQGQSLAPIGPVSLDVGIDPTTGQYYAQGDHTVTATVGSGSSSATFNLANAAPQPWETGSDVDPVAVPGTVVGVDAGGFEVRRWVFQDLTPGGLGSYVLPENPQSMAALPMGRPTVSAVHTTSRTAGRFHFTDAVEQPQPWNFTGTVLDSQEEFREKLIAYTALNKRWYLHDHRNRVWTVTFLSVDLQPQMRDADNVIADQRHKYTVNAMIYSRDWKVAQ